MPDDEIPDVPQFSAEDFKDEPVVPNHRASKEQSQGFSFFRPRTPVGDRRTTTKQPRPKVVVPKVRPGHFVEPLTQIYTGFGIAILPFDPVCANAVQQAAGRCAESLDNLAQENESVRRALFALTKTTAVGMVFVAHMPILLAVVIHHVPTAQNMLGAMGQEMAENIARQMEQNQNPPENPDA